MFILMFLDVKASVFYLFSFNISVVLCIISSGINVETVKNVYLILTLYVRDEKNKDKDKERL